MSNLSPGSRIKVLHIISGDLWAGAEAQAHTLLKHLKPLCDVSAVLMNEGELASRLRECEIPVMIIDEGNLSAWQIFMRLRAQIRQVEPDIVHTHRQKENILGSLANATTYRAASVRTVHGAQEFSRNWRSTLQCRVDQFIGIFLQSAIIAVSVELKNKLVSCYPPSKVFVVSNGVDIAAVRKAASITEFKKMQPLVLHIGIIGRLVQVKRVDIFLEIASLARKEYTAKYHFHIIGDGPLREALEQQAAKLQIQSSVTFHGQRDDIPSCINSLDAVLMCSDHEGMPMVALEALALGKPILTHLPSLIGISKNVIDVNDGSTTSKPQLYMAALTGNLQRIPSGEDFSSEKNAEDTFRLYTRVITARIY